MISLFRKTDKTKNTAIHSDSERLIKKIADKTPKEMKFQGILLMLANDEITVQEAIDKINKAFYYR